jgi:hypothetical protein
MEDVLPLVFSCVNPEEIVFCKDFKIINSFNDTVIAMTQNDGIALSGKPYNQIYLHIITVEEGKIIRLIEAFDSSLANDSLWGDSKQLIYFWYRPFFESMFLISSQFFYFIK